MRTEDYCRHILSETCPTRYANCMDSISRYHISVREDGFWNVIDAKSGEPAELVIEGVFHGILFRLPKDEAEGWSSLLNGWAGPNWRKNPRP